LQVEIFDYKNTRTQKDNWKNAHAVVSNSQANQ